MGMQRINCPFCSYDLSAIPVTWTDVCPLEGLCSECGKRFSWRQVFRPVGTPWQHSPSIRSWLVTAFLLIVVPRRTLAKVEPVKRPYTYAVNLAAASLSGAAPWFWFVMAAPVLVLFPLVFVISLLLWLCIGLFVRVPRTTRMVRAHSQLLGHCLFPIVVGVWLLPPAFLCCWIAFLLADRLIRPSLPPRVMGTIWPHEHSMIMFTLFVLVTICVLSVLWSIVLSVLSRSVLMRSGHDCEI